MATTYAFPSDKRTSDPNIARLLRDNGVPLCEAAWVLSGSPGMELRDYFAGQALTNVNPYGAPRNKDIYAEIAETCYRMADAMLAAREKGAV